MTNEVVSFLASNFRLENGIAWVGIEVYSQGIGFEAPK